MGSQYFFMSDIYGTGYSTTEKSIPDADDQNSLVDDQKASVSVQPETSNRWRILLAVLLVLIFVVVIGGRL